MVANISQPLLSLSFSWFGFIINMLTKHTELLPRRFVNSKPIILFIGKVIKEKIHLLKIVLHLIHLTIFIGETFFIHQLLFRFLLFLLQLFELLWINKSFINCNSIIVSSIDKGRLVSCKVRHLSLYFHFFILSNLFSIVHLS